jgi:hypothetical protein
MSADVEVVFTPWPYDAVARGAALLNERVPGWRERLQLRRLHMEDCEQCVLGQIYGDYVMGLDALWPDLVMASEDSTFGFDLVRPYPPSPSKEERYKVLAAAWREAIAGGAA